MIYHALPFRSGMMVFWLALLALAGAACSPAQTPLPFPAGATTGQSTFVYYYTDG